MAQRQLPVVEYTRFGAKGEWLFRSFAWRPR